MSGSECDRTRNRGLIGAALATSRSRSAGAGRAACRPFARLLPARETEHGPADLGAPRRKRGALRVGVHAALVLLDNSARNAGGAAAGALPAPTTQQHAGSWSYPGRTPRGTTASSGAAGLAACAARERPVTVARKDDRVRNLAGFTGIGGVRAALVGNPDERSVA